MNQLNDALKKIAPGPAAAAAPAAAVAAAVAATATAPVAAAEVLRLGGSRKTF